MVSIAPAQLGLDLRCFGLNVQDLAARQGDQSFLLYRNHARRSGARLKLAAGKSQIVTRINFILGELHEGNGPSWRHRTFAMRAFLYGDPPGSGDQPTGNDRQGPE
jgi:hypothetical protein